MLMSEMTSGTSPPRSRWPRASAPDDASTVARPWASRMRAIECRTCASSSTTMQCAALGPRERLHAPKVTACRPPLQPRAPRHYASPHPQPPARDDPHSATRSRASVRHPVRSCGPDSRAARRRRHDAHLPDVDVRAARARPAQGLRVRPDPEPHARGAGAQRGGAGRAPPTASRSAPGSPRWTPS